MSPTQTTINQAVSEQIRAHLAARKMTQQELAAELQWHPRFLSRRMTGEIPWSVAEVAGIAEVLRIPVLDLAYPQAS